MYMYIKMLTEFDPVHVQVMKTKRSVGPLMVQHSHSVFSVKDTLTKHAFLGFIVETNIYIV